MALTKLQRELVSRGTAFAIGLLLLRPCLYFAGGIAETAREAAAWRETHAGGEPPRAPVGTLFFFAAAFGLASASLIVFAILPTRALYALPLVSPPADYSSTIMTGVERL